MIDEYRFVGSERRVEVRYTNPTTSKGDIVNATVLWILAAILVIVGIVQLFQGQIILGVVLIVAGCLVGPGGYSVFRNRA